MKPLLERIKFRLLGAAALMAAACLNANAQDEPENIDAQANEVRIMARVLNDSLAPVLRGGEDGPESGHAPSPPDPPEGIMNSGAAFAMPVKGSPFEVHRPPVSGNYIPTVGAIFNVRANFPLSEPPAPREDKHAQPKSQNTDDLWQRNSQQPSGMGDFVQAIGPDGLSPELMGRFRGPGLPEFDPQRVAQLRNTLIGAIARYGHRMASLKDDERIVLVVSTARPTNVFAFKKPVEAKQGGGEGAPRPMVVKPISGGPAGGRDEIVLSFRKSDLKEAMEANQLEGRVIERHVRGETFGGIPFIGGDSLPPLFK